MNRDRSSFSGAAIGRSPPRIDQDEDEDEPEEPDEPDFEPDEREEPDFAVDDDFAPDDDPFDADDFDAEDFDAEDFDAEDFDAVDPEDVEPEPPSPPVTCRTSFFAPSSTVSPTSPARAIAKSFAVWTPSWTVGWFHTRSAAVRICS
ncbi:hypothetical protein [Agromyces tropicus]|uniref:hypothetical protein n=1 Tax=Agromyces tropicus TaxID=555371 RepID=UPI0031D68967